MSRMFPSQFPVITDPNGIDADDPFMVGQDGLVVGAARSAVRPGMLPTGFADTADFAATTGSLINGGATTTGWAASFVHSGGVTADTGTFTEGTTSILALLELDAGKNSKLWYTPPGGLSVSGRTLIAFDVRFTTDGPVHNAPIEFEARVADGVNLNTGNINRVSLAAVPYGAWQTVVLPLAGLSQVISVGAYRAVTTTGGASDRVFIRIDNVRFLNETRLDSTLGSALDVVAWVSPDYTPNASQTSPFIPAGKAIVDPALGVYSKQNNVLWLHDYLAHIPGAETGLVDVSVAVSRIVNAAGSGSVVRASPSAVYRFDSDVTWVALRGVEIDFTGSIIILTYQANNPFMTLSGCTDVTLRCPTIFGYKTTQHLGSGLVTVAGTPTVAGSGVVLDALNEEVQMQDEANWALPHHFARVMPQQIPVADDGLGPRNYFTVTLSDTTHVASDCVVTIYDANTTAVLAQQTLTLTAVATAYPITYFPTDLGKRLRLTVKKATATTNSITVAAIQSWGRVNYEAAFDIGSGILPVGVTRRTTMVEPWVEGVSGDAIQISDNNVRHVLIIDPVSRACRRQGFSFNRGEDMTIVRPIARETGRSGIDIEPFANTWFTRNIRIYDVLFYNITNYGLAMQNWARNFNVIIDGVDMYDTRLGVIFGGCTGGVLKNMRNWSNTGLGMSADFDFIGSSMEVSDIRSKVAIQTHTNTNTFDDGLGGGVITYTPNNNIMRSQTCAVVAGSGVLWVAGWRPDTLVDVTVPASSSVLAVAFAGYTIPNGVYGVRIETNWDSGYPYITAKTNAGFTINFPFQAPADGSGRITWSWQ